jgi:hypothetical protein
MGVLAPLPGIRGRAVTEYLDTDYARQMLFSS